MIEPARPDVLSQARAAASRQEWAHACELFSAADAAEPLGAADLAVLADAAYGAGLLETTIESWERAHALAVAAGDDLAAAGAAVRVALHLMIDTGLLAPVRGWAGRAERHLDGHDDTPVHAWLAIVRSYERLLSGDLGEVVDWARAAVDIGTRRGVPAAAALGRMAEARCRIFQGDVAAGLRLLDEAALAAVSGELDPLSVGIVYCELLCACKGIAQFERAEEWTDAMERWRRSDGIGSFGGRCRVHRAEMLQLRGASDEAERQAAQACDELRPFMRLEYGWPLTELGTIRLRKGDLAGAEEAFLSAHEIGWDPQPGLALLRLEQGDPAAAAALIRDALDHPVNVPSKELPPNKDLRRAPLLDAQVRIEIAAGDLALARAAAGELDRIAGAFDSKGLGASAAASRGRVALASGDGAAAARDFRDAVRLWNEVGAPHESALARTGLANAYLATGNEDGARLELRAARSTFERIGAVREARRAAASEQAAARPESAPAPLESSFRREGDVWAVAFDGSTIRVKHLLGMEYIARLLGDPGREFHVLDLVALVSPPPQGTHAAAGPAARLGDAGAMLDERAKESYRRRLAEIEEDLNEARAFDNGERAARAEAERDFVVRELSRAIGLGGEHRRAGSASERARASVTQAIRHAMQRIGDYHPALGEHFHRVIRTGTYCVYLPDPRVPSTWSL